MYIDPHVLSTLDKDEILGGFAEVIKYGVIWDAEFFNYLNSNKEQLLQLDPEALVNVLYTCCKIKAEVVAKDERESNLRRILNYGHTVGHAVEAASDFTLIHGKAVAIGMVAAARIAVEKNIMSKKDFTLIKETIDGYGLPVEVPQHFKKEALKNYMLSDKKVVSGTVSYVLPEKIGKVVILMESMHKMLILPCRR